MRIYPSIGVVRDRNCVSLRKRQIEFSMLLLAPTGMSVGALTVHLVVLAVSQIDASDPLGRSNDLSRQDHQLVHSPPIYALVSDHSDLVSG